MPPQKNSGNKGAKRETGVSVKNNKFIQSFLDDVRKEGNVKDVYVARILKKMGNGRVEAFYVDEKSKPFTVQAVIRGSFRGRGKRSVWIEDNSIVIIVDSGIGGSAEFEVMALLSPDQVRELRKAKDIDPRILALGVTDAELLTSGKPLELDEGFVFENSEGEEDSEVDIDDI
jgi:hypothetical protein